MKFSVVPDSSERLTGVIRVSGSSTSGLSLAIAGSFQVVIFWLKISASVRRRELQRFDAFEVVDDRDRRDVGRDLDQLARVAAFRRLLQFAFFFAERRVAAGEGDAAGDELFAAAARADGVVGDRGVGVCVLEFGDPGFLGGLLGGRAGAGDLTGERCLSRRHRAAAVAAAARRRTPIASRASAAKIANHLEGLNWISFFVVGHESSQ